MSDTESSDAYLTAQSSREDSPADALSSALGGLRLTAARDESPRPAKVRVLIQDACRKHRYARDEETWGIVERPERLRALNVGIAAAWARRGGDAALAVAAQMDRLALGSSKPAAGTILSGAPFDVVSSNHRLKLSSKAVEVVHSESNKPPTASVGTQTTPVFPAPTYGNQLSDWIGGSASAHAAARSEVPAHLPQGDLYLCPGSLDAIEGALGTTCAAVEEALTQGGTRFAAIRPPGHHCSTALPSGFCLVNNVLVGAAHAHERYDVDRVIVFDIDLHHGDGTQDIVHRINAQSELEAQALKAKLTPRTSPRPRRSPSPARKLQDEPPVEAADAPLPRRPLKILYTSLHDIESFPCEDGDEDRVTNASMRISGGHGHFICNVHLESYESDADFHVTHYPAYRTTLFDAARDFLRKTSATPDKTLVIISAGFDASEHETPSMQRHGKRVPTSFFARFAADAIAFAAEHASDRMVAVLEGGYSDRALASGMASFLDGCLGYSSSLTASPWDLKTLMALEKACEGKAPGSKAEPWLSIAQSAFCALEGVSFSSAGVAVTPRELRERRPRPLYADEQSPPKKSTLKARTASAATVTPASMQEEVKEPVKPETNGNELPPPAIGKFKLTFKAGGIQ